MNSDQVTSLLRVLLAAGGPVAGLLANAGMAAGTVNNILTVALIVLPPLISAVWGFVVHTDQNKIAAAAAVDGVTQIRIDPLATGAAAAAAADSALPTVKKGL
jgi:hypothetical protein